MFAAIDAFEYPELHDESIAARSFFSQLSKLMAVCGVKDFGMKARAHALKRVRLPAHHADGAGRVGPQRHELRAPLVDAAAARPARAFGTARTQLLHAPTRRRTAPRWRGPPSAGCLSNRPLPIYRPQDVHKPETQRLRRHLSAVINFAKFREEKLVAYAELQVRHTSAARAHARACGLARCGGCAAEEERRPDA